MNYLKSIYQYKNYRKYLIDFYRYKKKQSPNFTYQQFSKLAKIFCSSDWYLIIIEIEDPLDLMDIKFLVTSFQIEKTNNLVNYILDIVVIFLIIINSILVI